MTDASEPQEAGKAPSLTLNLSSNNPFRNRAVSPNSLPRSPASPFEDPNPRPVSRNPFLDPAGKPAPKSFDNMVTKDRASPTAEEIFDNLTLDDKEPNKERRPVPPPGRGPPRPPTGPMGRGGPPRDRENMPPPGRRMPPRHRPTRSQEEALRARKMQGGSSGGGSSMSPNRRPDRRPRRNSESSIASGEKGLTEEEKKARDARRRERERRHRERESSTSKDTKDKPPRSNKRMDIIDQLDATSIFGGGFHHDGPFDALNPHRNRHGSRRAPMQAFPKDSLNNVLGGSGPVNKRPDHATFMGTGVDEGYKDYSNGAIPSDKMGSSSHMPPVFDPLSRSHVLHGEESLGLGTSTFLEGTPAARSTVQRRDAEKVQESQAEGLQRKKSLAQRIRGINSRPQRDFASGRMTNPEGAMRSPQAYDATSSSYHSGAAERNPFFNEYDKKGEEQISVRRADTIGVASPMSPNSPGQSNTTRGAGAPLERRATIDSAAEEQPRSGGGGLLARVKSLKGGRRARPAEPTTAAPPPPARDA